jgi:CRP/FNR family transcriptional regulator, cyclic AMP receptor protein
MPTEPPDFARLLSVNPFFAPLGSDVVKAIASLCVTRSLEAGEVLFMKGDPGDALYGIRRGEIRIGAGTDTGRRATFNILGAGDVFGEVALLDGRPRTADAVAAERSELFVIRRRDFVAFLERSPAVAVRIIELLCERVRWMSERMEESMLLPLPTRLARRLLALAEDFGSELRVSQEELAAFVGATRESVNRQLQAWKRRGFIDLSRGRILLIDRDGLSGAGEAAAD